MRVSAPRTRVLVNATVSSPPMVTVPSAGTTVVVQCGSAVSATVQDVPVGMPVTVALPVPPDVVIDRVVSYAVPAQSTAKANVPSTSALLVMVSAPRTRVLVNATVFAPVPIVTVPSAGTTVVVQCGSAVSVTVQDVPVGMPVTSALPVPPDVVIDRVVSYAVPSQSTANANVPSRSALLVTVSAPRTRVLVNATVLAPVPITTVPSAGTTAVVQCGSAVSATEHEVPVGMPVTSALLVPPDVVIDRVVSYAVPSQSTVNANVPSRSADLVTVSAPRKRVLVNATVLSPVAMLTEPPVGVTIDENSGFACSVTVQDVPVGMPSSCAEPVPFAVVMVSVVSYAVPSQSTSKWNVPSSSDTFVTSSAPVLRVFVNVTVCPPASMVTVPLAGLAVVLNSAFGVSATVQWVPASMASDTCWVTVAPAATVRSTGG